MTSEMLARLEILTKLKVKMLKNIWWKEYKNISPGLIKSIDVNETDEYGYTGLHLAAEHGHMKVVEELMVIIFLFFGCDSF